MRKIIPIAENILREHYDRLWSIVKTQYSLGEPRPSILDICLIEAQNDPDFYRWLFGDLEISDFGGNLSDEDFKIAQDFFESL